MPSVRMMVAEYLRANNFDGLAGDDCGCELSDLMPCSENDISTCEGGHKVKCPTEEHDGWQGGWCCDGECEWHMEAGPRP